MPKEDHVEFKWLEPRLQGNNTVLFRLDDGALVKIKVDINRAGIATNFRNPDGSPHYNIETNLNIQIVPQDKTYRIPKSSIQTQQPPAKPPPSGQVS